MGGVRPDQALSNIYNNIYKMYRAMRPGRDSPILRTEQPAVPQLDEVKPYRPVQLSEHSSFEKYYS